LRFFDHRPLLGRSKTIRGVVASVALATLAAPAAGLPLTIGATIGMAAMAGDIFSSFVKRRLGMASSSQALGLDQIPESLLPLLAVQPALSLDVSEIVLVTAFFLVGELVLSRLLYAVHLRDRPY